VEDYKATIGADFLTKEIRIGENNITLQVLILLSLSLHLSFSL
jgi:hypothetical protein